MNAKDLAALLNGREYGREITKEESAAARSAGLVVVYGYSDDNAEFEGAIYDEVGCYEGDTFYLTNAGLLKNDCDNDECPHFDVLRKSAASIEAVWDKDGYSWQYKTDIPHETFEIVEDGEKYCRGIVFALADVGKKADTRDAFEAWVRGEPFFAYNDLDEVIERDDKDGGYIDANVHGAWMAWNARGAA